jgi:hypothetical protein
MQFGLGGHVLMRGLGAPIGGHEPMAVGASRAACLRKRAREHEKEREKEESPWRR